MKLGLSVIVILCAAFSAVVYSAEDHLVPKHGEELKHNHRKRDLSAADAECILKTLLSKLEHSKDSELPKVYSISKNHRFRGSEMMGKAPHLASMKEEEIEYLGKSVPLEHKYKESHNPRESGHGMKKDLTEKDIMALLMRMTALTAAKESEAMSKKDYRTPEDKLLSRTMRSKDSSIKKMSDKMLEDDTYPDKFSDTEVSLAESLHHMKIAGDVQTYPEIKMASLYEKKLAEEKMLAEEDDSLHNKNSDESYMKKVDEFGKSLFKEETYKDDNIGEYLEKAPEEEKESFDDVKVGYPEKAFSMEENAEEKALDSLKSDHKELFPVEEGFIMEEKFKHKDPHHAEGGPSHDMSDELLKKFKTSLGMDKDLDAEHDDLLLPKKGLHTEGTEITDDMLKKIKTMLVSEKELGEEHEELIHLLKELHKEEEEAKGSVAYEKAKEQARRDANIGLNGKDMKKHIEDPLAFGSKDMVGTELFGKGLSAEKSHGIASKDVHLTDLFFIKGLSSEKAHGIDSKDIHGTDDLFFKKGLSAEKAYGMGSKDVHGTDLFFEKGMPPVKAHDIDSKIGVGIEKSMHGEEAKKGKEMPGLEKSFDIEKDKAMRGGKAAIGDEFKHSIKHEISFPTIADKAFKVPEDEFFKKEKAYGTDIYFHGDKGTTGMTGGHHIHHILKGEKGHVLHDSADKHLVEGAVETGKGHKTLHDLKTKFFEVLTRVLRTKKFPLVTMRPSELLGIVNCISKSKDPILCEKFSVCEKKMPSRVMAALEKCKLETISGETKKCNRHSPLHPSSEFHQKACEIFKCVALNIKELAPEEKKQMIEFEECARVIKAENCGIFKRFRRLQKEQ